MGTWICRYWRDIDNAQADQRDGPDIMFGRVIVGRSASSYAALFSVLISFHFILRVDHPQSRNKTENIEQSQLTNSPGGHQPLKTLWRLVLIVQIQFVCCTFVDGM